MYNAWGKLLLHYLIYTASGVADQLNEPKKTATVLILIPSLPEAETDTHADALPLSSPSPE